MEHSDLREHLSRLENQVQLLLEKYETAKDELAQLKQENQQLRSESLEKSVQIENFQNHSKISKIVEYLGMDENPSELKEKIDEYIVEIDRCISYLSKEL